MACRKQGRVFRSQPALVLREDIEIRGWWPQEKVGSGLGDLGEFLRSNFLKSREMVLLVSAVGFGEAECAWGIKFAPISEEIFAT